MTVGPLAGHGIVVTRPLHQAAELATAIEAAGGTILLLPLLTIVPRDAQAVAAEAGDLPAPDIVIYVSPNAVRHGIAWQSANAAVAAVGPATRAELMTHGITHVICQDDGFDSESLLEHKELTQVSGKVIRIVRGQDGRELLGNMLRDRGARVDHLTVYHRIPGQLADSERRAFESRLRNGEISCITVMSVAALDSLLGLLPGERRALLRKTRLVTPSRRVLKNIAERMPGLSATLAPGPQANDMIVGLTASLKQVNTE
jgi:uroporphyrinogen-III synthase